jgi:hypothetical protein
MKKTIMSLALFAMTATSIQFTPQHANAGIVVTGAVAIAMAKAACSRADDGRDFAYQWRVIAGQGFEGTTQKCSGFQFLSNSDLAGQECHTRRKGVKNCRKIPKRKFGNRCNNAKKAVSRTNKKIRGATGGRASVSNCNQSIKNCTYNRGHVKGRVKGKCQRYRFTLEF